MKPRHITGWRRHWSRKINYRRRFSIIGSRCGLRLIFPKPKRSWTKFWQRIPNSANFLKMLELPRKQLIATICMVLAAGTFAVYFPVLSHIFINYDDPDYIVGNSHVNAGLTWSG